MSGLPTPPVPPPLSPAQILARLLTVDGSGSGLDADLLDGHDTSYFQVADPELAAVAALVSAADRLPYFTGSGTAALAVFTAAGRALVDDADAAAQRTTLGLGTMATQAASGVAITGGTVTGITDLTVADGGTGASTASGARTNLGLGTISTQDANNVTISGGAITGITDLAVADGGTGSSTAGGARTNLGLGTLATQDANNVTITGGSVSGITDLAVADGGTGASTAGAARTNLGLAIGSDVQAYDPDLAAIAGLTSAADKLPYFTGSGTAGLADFTAAGRALLDDADASAQRTTLGLGTMATQAASAVAITGGAIDGTPVGGTTKAAGSFTTGVFTGALTVGSSALGSRSTITTDGSTACLRLLGSDGSAANTATVLILDHTSSVAAAAGFGVAMDFCGRTDSGSGTPNVPMATLEARWIDATTASRKGLFYWSVYDGSTSRTGVELDAIAGGCDVRLIPGGVGTTTACGTADATSAAAAAFVSLGGIASAKNIIGGKGLGLGVTSTATAAGTTTLTASSTFFQTFTGVTTQTVQFPAANLLGAGIAVMFAINNQSSGAVTAARAGGDTFQGGGTTDTIVAGATTWYASDGVSVWMKV